MELTPSMREAFIQWAKSRPPMPLIEPHHVLRWSRQEYGNEDVPPETCDELVQEVWTRALEARSKRMEIARSLQVPGLGLPLGYLPNPRNQFLLLDFHEADQAQQWKAATLTNREVCMLKLVEELTNKREWWAKVHDPEIAGRWKKEALGFDWDSYCRYGDFTESMADACIHELRTKAELYQRTGLIPIFDYSTTVVKSDRLVPQSLSSAFRTAVKALEDVPDKEKDWHPNSKKKVLNLVHPSLYPFVHGRTPVLLDKRIGVSEAIDHCGMGTVLSQPWPQEALGPFIGGVAGRGLGEDETYRYPMPSISNKFQWLPCDVTLDGGSAKLDSYINNLHPTDHAELYPIIEKFIERSLPAWDLIHRWPNEFCTQRIKAKEAVAICHAGARCRETTYQCNPWNRPLEPGESYEDEDSMPYRLEYFETERYRKDRIWWEATHEVKLPEPTPPEEATSKTVAPSDVKSEGFFDGASRIQVIVKLANIHLTPEDPECTYSVSSELQDFYLHDQMDVDPSETSSFHPASHSSPRSPSPSDVSNPYPLSQGLPDYTSLLSGYDPTTYDGGSYHVEGFPLNEHIVSTALFYYDSHNITPSHLDFRTLANAEDDGMSVSLRYEQHAHHPISRVFAIERPGGGDSLQYIGGVQTTFPPEDGDDEGQGREEGSTRAVFFPNTLQHRLSPFRLADPTKPGHRKILALFLVDPSLPIVSTANVAPQQRSWWERETRFEAEVLGGSSSRLPAELREMVLREMDEAEGVPVSLERARETRLEMMEERSVGMEKTEEMVMNTGWNFCEH